MEYSQARCNVIGPVERRQMRSGGVVRIKPYSPSQVLLQVLRVLLPIVSLYSVEVHHRPDRAARRPIMN